jgi:rhodanese-related sulfurtransferase
MGDFGVSISSQTLIDVVGSEGAPLIIDVRRREAFEQAGDVIPTADWRDHRTADVWGAALTRPGRLVVYCAHGHQVSQSAAALLRGRGIRAAFLEGGIEAWREAGGPLIRKSALPARADGRPTRWVTRERPKIDRIACPWFIRRFIDRDADIYFVAADRVREIAAELDAIPFDIPDTDFSHEGEKCSFDAFLARFGVADRALDELALIVRGADTARLDLAPQCAGLLAISLGLSAVHADDLTVLRHGMMVYDALYGWCRFAQAESHNWPSANSSGAPAQAVNS